MDRRYNQPYDYRFHNSSPYGYNQSYDYDDEYDSYDPRAPRSFLPQTPPTQAQEQRGAEGSGQEEKEKEGERGTMASWFQRATGSQQAQFATTALVSGAVVAGAILGYQHVRRQERVEDLKSSIPELGRGHVADKVRFTFA
jgi:hypothetical protein